MTSRDWSEEEGDHGQDKEDGELEHLLEEFSFYKALPFYFEQVNNYIFNEVKMLQLRTKDNHIQGRDCIEFSSV